ncbi:hypothetical protein [Parvularcula lutaonensis]|uniref:Transmembrane protein n=1 Tax=Parvularcula lutaonensis TaxID=491923 RepID=A0ABV7M9L5_9PROT
MRILRAAVRLRRWKRRPGVAAQLARARRASPYALSALLNGALVLALAAGYTSFVAKGIRDGGLGDRVVSVEFFDAIPTEEPEPEIKAEDTDEPENAEVGAETLPEGNAIEEGEEVGELEGEQPPEEEVGEQTTAARVGVDIPSIALPEVDAGEGRPDGIVGVDCYAVFSDNREKALECAGREILSGWRAELASTLADDWTSFAETLGTGRRQIRYGPLRAPVNPQEFGYPSGLEVPPEVLRQYEEALVELRRRQAIQEFGRSSEVEQAIQEERERDQDAATYNPVSPSGS